MPEVIDIEAITIADKGIAVDLSNPEPMTEQEARDAVAQINMGAIFIRGKLLEIHRRRGWAALGYESWKEFAEEEFNKDRNTLYDVVKAAEEEARLIEYGVTVPEISGTPDSHLRTISQSPSPESAVKAFRQLQSWKQEGGEITAKDAEAAVWSVDTNKRYNKAQKLVADYISSNRDAAVSTAKPILEWAKEKKGLSNRQAEVLKDDIEVFVNSDRPGSSTRSPVPGSTPTTPSKPPTPAKPDKSLEIASFLNSYEPAEVAHAIASAMDEDYGIMLIREILPTLDIPLAIATFQEAKVSKKTAKVMSDKAFQFCQDLDEAFDLPSE